MTTVGVRHENVLTGRSSAAPPRFPRVPLTIAVAQPACGPKDVRANARAHAAAIRAADAPGWWSSPSSR